jgi:hypothetical protein
VLSLVLSSPSPSPSPQQLDERIFSLSCSSGTMSTTELARLPINFSKRQEDFATPGAFSGVTGNDGPDASELESIKASLASEFAATVSSGPTTFDTSTNTGSQGSLMGLCASSTSGCAYSGEKSFISNLRYHC